MKKEIIVTTIAIWVISVNCRVYGFSANKEETKELLSSDHANQDSFDQLSKEMNKLWEKVVTRNNGVGGFITNNSFNSYLDNNDKEYKLNIEVPGFDKQQISIELQGDYLVIKGEKPQDNSKNHNCYTNQQYRNSFYEKLQLPKDVNKDSI